jgi:hypothetical protein
MPPVDDTQMPSQFHGPVRIQGSEAAFTPPWPPEHPHECARPWSGSRSSAAG